MNRRLRITLVSSSLALCLLSLGMWGLGYFRCPFVYYTRAWDQRGWCGYTANSNNGRLVICWSGAASEETDGRPLGWMFGLLRVRVTFNSLLWGGVRFYHRDYQYRGYHNKVVGIPLLVPALVFSIFPLWTLRTHLRARREKKKGLCPHCGYDLRAAPDRCPECGRLPTPRAIS